MILSAKIAATIAGSASETNPPQRCWFCSAARHPAELFCAACGKLQPLSAGTSYFDVFGLPRKLMLDASSLQREFYRLSRRLHPDLYVRATPREQDWSLANSALLNDAYRTLKAPLARTEYLLQLEGIVSQDQGGGKKEVPADLLEEVFELNMQLDELRMNRQMGEDDAQLQRDLIAAKANFDGQLQTADADLQGLWRAWDAAIDDNEEAAKLTVKHKIAALLDRRRYVRNLVDSVDQALQA